MSHINLRLDFSITEAKRIFALAVHNTRVALGLPPINIDYTDLQEQCDDCGININEPVNNQCPCKDEHLDKYLETVTSSKYIGRFYSENIAQEEAYRNWRKRKVFSTDNSSVFSF